MIPSFRNGALRLGSDTMHYIRFGSGARTLIMPPGLGDGLNIVKGTALPMAMMQHAYAKDYTVYMFSRRNCLPEGYTTRDMACMKKQRTFIRSCWISSAKADIMASESMNRLHPIFSRTQRSDPS